MTFLSIFRETSCIGMLQSVKIGSFCLHNFREILLKVPIQSKAKERAMQYIFLQKHFRMTPNESKNQKVSASSRFYATYV